MKSRLNDYVCVDLPKQVRNWVPNDPEEVYYYMELTIGEDTSAGGDLFGLTVATPKALLKRMRTWGDKAYPDVTI